MTSITTNSPALPPLAAEPPPSDAMLRRDFPGWLPPMLVKELRQGLRTRGFVGALVLFQLIMMIATLVSLASQVAIPRAGGAGSALTAFFWTILIVQLLLVTPTRAVGGLQAEVETRTLDLLVLTRLNAWRIVLGKWFSLLAQAVLLLVAMLPYLVVRYFTDSADIAGDLGRCVIMLGVSALLTGAGLWASGVAKVLRVVAVIVLAATLPTIAGGFGPTFFSRTLGAPGGPFAGVFTFPLDMVNGALIGAFFLVSAVRNIAPPAENHGLFARSLPVLAMGLAAMAAAYGAHAIALRQLYISGAFLAAVGLFELASVRKPMAPHWRDCQRRGLLMRGVGRCSLPGWESALGYVLVAAIVWIVLALIIIPTGTVSSRAFAERVAWLGLLAVAGLVFPAAARSFVQPRQIPPAVLYAIGLVAPVLLSWIGIGLAESKWKLTAVKSIMEVMPVSSFLFSASSRSAANVVLSLQGGIALLVIAAALWRTRPYWARVRAFDRDEAPTVVAP